MSDVATVALATLTGLTIMVVAAGVIELVYRVGGDRFHDRFEVYAKATMLLILAFMILGAATILGGVVLELFGYDTGFFNGGGVAV